MNMRVLVTGSNGFLGKRLVAILRQYQMEVTETGGSTQLDLCDDKLVQALPQTDAIVHLAGRSFIPDSFLHPRSFYSNNFLATLNLLEHARKTKARFVYFSTYVYGTPKYLPIDELHPANPLNPYTSSKLLGEDLCRSYHTDFGVPVTIFRPFNVYGPGQEKSFLIPRIISQLKEETIQLQDPEPKRDFVYIDDLLEAVRLSLEYGSNGYHLYNLGSGSSTSVEELAALIKQLSGSQSRILYSREKRQGEVLETVADITRIERELGWKPITTLREGLARIIFS